MCTGACVSLTLPRRLIFDSGLNLRMSNKRRNLNRSTGLREYNGEARRPARLLRSFEKYLVQLLDTVFEVPLGKYSYGVRIVKRPAARNNLENELCAKQRREWMTRGTASSHLRGKGCESRSAQGSSSMAAVSRNRLGVFEANKGRKQKADCVWVVGPEKQALHSRRWPAGPPICGKEAKLQRC